MLGQQNHAAGGANKFIIVRMLVYLCFISQKPSEREFAVPAGTDYSKERLREILYQVYHMLKNSNFLKCGQVKNYLYVMFSRRMKKHPIAGI